MKSLKLTARFSNTEQAWRFYKTCDTLGMAVSFPSLGNIAGHGYTVQYEAKPLDLVRLQLETGVL